MGNHRAPREGRRAQTFHVTHAVIIPQGFGALLSECRDDRGNIDNTSGAPGRDGCPAVNKDAMYRMVQVIKRLIASGVVVANAAATDDAPA